MSEMETKFKYYYKHKKDGDIQTEIFTLDEIENCYVDCDLTPKTYMNSDGYEFLAREQFTGLTDKNGEEIYCGDVLEVGIKTPYIGVRYTKCYVYFDGGAFALVKKGKKWVSLSNISSEVSLETIGNIYQNKDLLNDSN